MPSSSCRCWKARRPWWAPWAKDKPSSPPSTSWEVKEHWAPSVSTRLGCGLPAWTDACVAVASKRLNFQWKSKLDTVLDPSDAIVIMCLKPADWIWHSSKDFLGKISYTWDCFYFLKCMYVCECSPTCMNGPCTCGPTEARKKDLDLL